MEIGSKIRYLDFYNPVQRRRI